MTREALEDLIRTVSEDGYHHPHLEVHCHMALRKLEELIEQNEATHEPMNWKAEGMSGNWDHLEGHFSDLVRFGLPDAVEHPERFGKDDMLLNLTCRCLFLLQLREEARNKQ